MNREGILLFSKEGPSNSLGDLYLLGFGQSRPDFGKTGNFIQEDREFREKLKSSPTLARASTRCGTTSSARRLLAGNRPLAAILRI